MKIRDTSRYQRWPWKGKMFAAGLRNRGDKGEDYSDCRLLLRRKRGLIEKKYLRWRTLMGTEHRSSSFGWSALITNNWIVLQGKWHVHQHTRIWTDWRMVTEWARSRDRSLFAIIIDGMTTASHIDQIIFLLFVHVTGRLEFKRTVLLLLTSIDENNYIFVGFIKHSIDMHARMEFTVV